MSVAMASATPIVVRVDDGGEPAFRPRPSSRRALSDRLSTISTEGDPVCAPTMPRQHHFLSRLDRIAAPQVEMALDLYRDHKLLRFLLERARIPDGAPRVALSVDHPERGPFLIVTRDGTFVTCLAEGMTVGDLPIITRKRLDGITAKHADLKARFETRRQLVGRLGGTGKLLARVYDAGEDLSREELVALSEMQPLLWKDLSKLQIETSTGLGEVREQLLHLLRRTDKLKGPALELLEGYYRSTWASAHPALERGHFASFITACLLPPTVQ
jgi:hypothetical protein